MLCYRQLGQCFSLDSWSERDGLNKSRLEIHLQLLHAHMTFSPAQHHHEALTHRLYLLLKYHTLGQRDVHGCLACQLIAFVTYREADLCSLCQTCDDTVVLTISVDDWRDESFIKKTSYKMFFLYPGFLITTKGRFYCILSRFFL